ncbi:hypothetical protein QYF36_009968 [Acer negundo]|nr:hypothetical protein QYF36_009968 [Acer negundo]
MEEIAAHVLQLEELLQMPRGGGHAVRQRHLATTISWLDGLGLNLILHHKPLGNKQQCQITNPEGKKKSMNEIRVTWNNLSRKEKSQYTMSKNDVVDEKVHVVQDILVVVFFFLRLAATNC